MTTWIDSEPGYFALRHELGRLVHRARRRRNKVLLASAAITALAVIFTLRLPRKYDAQITVRVTEIVDFHLPRSVWTDRELRSFVTQVAFTNQVLGEMYEKHLADIAPAPTVIRGIERLREDIEVYAARNRVAVELEGTTGPRSAHVILRYSANREDRALAVLKGLVAPIIESSAKRRRLEAEQEASRVALSLENAQALLEQTRKQAIERAGRLMAGAGSLSPVALMELDSALKSAHLRVARYQQEMDDALRRKQAEKRKSGLDFDVIEESVKRPLPLAPLVLVVAILSFLLALPIAAIVTGAASSTIDSLEDVRKLGIPALGQLPRLVPVPPRVAPPTATGSGNGEKLTL
jgi:uncharacterized protein involved in exopolysaccharide biosynthesis